MMKRPSPSDIRKGQLRSPRLNVQRIHIVDTEARTLEEACDIIAAQQRINRAATTQKNRQMSLRQQMGLAKAQGHWRPISLAGGVVKQNMIKKRGQKRAHPFWDLTEDQKRDKIRELFAGGLWGVGTYACRKLAQRFRVTVGQVILWTEDIRSPL